VLSYFVFINTVIAAPVVHVHNRVTIHGGGMTAAAANNLMAFWLDWRVSKLGDKPNASRTSHACASVAPKVF
jgi:hypothetical protein